MAPASRSADAANPLAEDPRVKAIAKLVHKPGRTLADYHRIGQKVHELERNPAVTAGGAGWKKRVAEVVGASEATLNKCLQFSNAYEPADLPELEELESRWARVTVSLAVEDRAERHQLLHQAREEDWTDRELQRRLQQRRGTRRGGGRHRRPLRGHGLQADAAQLVELLRSVDQFLTQVWTRNRDQYRSDAARLDGAARETTRQLLGESRRLLLEVAGGLQYAAQELNSYERRLPAAGPEGR